MKIIFFIYRIKMKKTRKTSNRTENCGKENQKLTEAAGHEKIPVFSGDEPANCKNLLDKKDSAIGKDN